MEHGAILAEVKIRGDVSAYTLSLWFVLSLINAGLAQGKGRRGFVWWLLSLLLGPIATFLIVILPAASEQYEE